VSEETITEQLRERTLKRFDQVGQNWKMLHDLQKSENERLYAEIERLRAANEWLKDSRDLWRKAAKSIEMSAHVDHYLLRSKLKKQKPLGSVTHSCSDCVQPQGCLPGTCRSERYKWIFQD